METVETYPSYKLLTGLFLLVALVHVYMISDMQPMKSVSAPAVMKKTLLVNLQNTWKAPIIKPKQTRLPIAKKQAPRPVNPLVIPEKKPPQPPIPERMEIRPVKHDRQQADRISRVSTKKEVKPNPVIKPDLPPINNQKSADQKPAPKTADTIQSTKPPVQLIPQPPKPEKNNLADRTEKVAAATAPQRIAKTTENATINWNSLVSQFIRQIDVLDYYPSNARRRRQQGTVILRVTLSKTAKVKSVDIARSSRFTKLDNAALNLIEINKKDLEDIIEPYHTLIQKPVQLRLPIRFALR